MVPAFVFNPLFFHLKFFRSTAQNGRVVQKRKLSHKALIVVKYILLFLRFNEIPFKIKIKWKLIEWVIKR